MNTKLLVRAKSMCNETTAISIPEPPAYRKKLAKYNELQMHSESIRVCVCVCVSMYITI